MADPRPQIRFPFPVKGVTENCAYGVVPEGYALESLNVVGFDVLEGRLRGGKRPGTGRAVRDPVDAEGTPVFRMRQVTLDSAEFIDAAGFFDDPFFDDGSGPTGEGSGGGWAFPRYDWDFDLNPNGPGGFGIYGVDAEYRRNPDAPPDEPLVALPVVSEEPFNYPDGDLVGNGPPGQEWEVSVTNKWVVTNNEARPTFASTLPGATAYARRRFGTASYDATYPFEVECLAAVHTPAVGACTFYILIGFGDFAATNIYFALSSIGGGMMEPPGGRVAVYEAATEAPIQQVAFSFTSGVSVRVRCVWNPSTRRCELWINDTKQCETPPVELTAAREAGQDHHISPIIEFWAENFSDNPSMNASGFRLDNIVVRGVLIEP